MEFDGLCRLVEWVKSGQGGFFSAGRNLMDCVAGLSRIRWLFISFRVDCAREPYMAAMWSVIPLTLL